MLALRYNLHALAPLRYAEVRHVPSPLVNGWQVGSVCYALRVDVQVRAILVLHRHLVQSAKCKYFSFSKAAMGNTKRRREAKFCPPVIERSVTGNTYADFFGGFVKAGRYYRAHDFICNRNVSANRSNVEEYPWLGH
jgi:hypothetical protein